MSDTIDSSSSDSAGKCPVDLETRSLWGLWGSKPASVPQTTTTTTTPASLEEAAKHAQTPHPHQRLPLSTHRLESTIPRGNANNNTPAHQIRVPNSIDNNTNDNNNNDNNNNWVYPSEQQVFNAMKRKGWSGIEEESIPSFLQIHNSVNERSWKQVQDWESDTNGNTIELSRFEGRPKDLTPKAWLLSTFGICDKPFDRHDWYVVHKDSPEEKRYVLDFYMTDDRKSTGLPKVEIDVRPALDSPRAFVQRASAILKEAFPGIARELDEQLRKR